MADYSGQVDRARSKLNEAGERVTDASRDASGALIDFIHESPVQATLIALGIGYLIGRMKLTRLL